MEKNKNKKLYRKQIDSKIAREREKPYWSPEGGWIQTIRQGLGISRSQLARKLGLTKPAIQKIEMSEEKGTITFSTFKKVADALNSELRVSLIPRRSLEQTIQEQALRKAREIVQRTNLHMSLEAQGTDSKFQEEQIHELAQDLIRTQDRRLWEDF